MSIPASRAATLLAVFVVASSSVGMAKSAKATDMRPSTVAEVGCVAPLTAALIDATLNWVDAPNNNTRAYWGERSLRESLRAVQSLSNPHDRAQCIAGVLTSGSKAVYDLMRVGQSNKAWSYASALAHLWQRYQKDSTANDRYRDYSDFPYEITEALNYICRFSPNCPPVPANVRDSIMRELLAR
jgi:hypothetical protein